MILRQSPLLRASWEFRLHHSSQPKQFSSYERILGLSSRIPWFGPRSIPVHRWLAAGKCTKPWPPLPIGPLMPYVGRCTEHWPLSVRMKTLLLPLKSQHSKREPGVVTQQKRNFSYDRQI